MIKETMSPTERLTAAVNLQLTDRVPTAPIIGQFALRHRGVPQSTAYRDPVVSTQALMDTFESLGGYDGVMQPCFVWPYYSWRISSAPTPMLMAGQGTGDDDHLQAAEKEIMTLEDYDIIIEPWLEWFLRGTVPEGDRAGLLKNSMPARRDCYNFSWAT